MTFFQFEADFVESLRCIPMVVRYKLDTCGIKLKLPQWHQFNQLERQKLVDLPVNNQLEISEYRNFLQQLVLNYTGTPATDLPIDINPPWLDDLNIPVSIREKAQSENVEITQIQWSKLSVLQKFALIKLSRSNHENTNFLPALKEFKLI